MRVVVGIELGIKNSVLLLLIVGEIVGELDTAAVCCSVVSLKDLPSVVLLVFVVVELANWIMSALVVVFVVFTESSMVANILICCVD